MKAYCKIFSQSWQTKITGLNRLMIFISDIGFCFSHKLHLKVTSEEAVFFDLDSPLDFASAMITPLNRIL
jgi:hypothetical protein